MFENVLRGEPRMRAVPFRVTLETSAVFVYAAVAVGWISADSGGYFPTSYSWAALVTLLLSTFAVVLRSRLTFSRWDAIFVGGLIALSAWSGLSVLWTASVPSTVDSTNRLLAYVGIVLFGLLACKQQDAERLIAGAATGATVISIYSLATRLFPDRLGSAPSLTSGYRLSDPIGYWNGLGLSAVMAALLCLGLAHRARRALPAAAAASAIPLLAVTAYFTFSRGAWLALAVGLTVALALDPRRAELTVFLAAAAAPTAAAVWLASRPAPLRVRGSSVAVAARAGHHLAPKLLVAAVAAGILAGGARLLVARIDNAPWFRKACMLVLLVAIAVGALLGIAKYGSPARLADRAWHQVRQPPHHGSTNLGSRLFDLSSNGRLSLWRVGWHDFLASPVVGRGGGTFWEAWAASPTRAFAAQDTHNLYVQTLAELGVVGLALLLVALALPLVAAWKQRRAMTGAFAGAYCAWLVHNGFDWDWQLTGVSAVGLLCAAALIVSARPAAHARTLRMPSRALTTGVLVGVAGWAFCSVMANVSLARATSSYAHGHLNSAERYSRRAAHWAPWSAEARDLEAKIAFKRGETERAVSEDHAAIRRDPGNWTLWLSLALASSGPTRRDALDHAIQLSPRGAPRELPRVRISVPHR